MTKFCNEVSHPQFFLILSKMGTEPHDILVNMSEDALNCKSSWGHQGIQQLMQNLSIFSWIKKWIATLSTCNMSQNDLCLPSGNFCLCALLVQFCNTFLIINKKLNNKFGCQNLNLGTCLFHFSLLISFTSIR